MLCNIIRKGIPQLMFLPIWNINLKNKGKHKRRSSSTSSLSSPDKWNDKHTSYHSSLSSIIRHLPEYKGNMDDNEIRIIPRRTQDQDLMKTELWGKVPHKDDLACTELGTHDVIFLDSVPDLVCAETFWETFRVEPLVHGKKGATAYLWNIDKVRGKAPIRIMVTADAFKVLRNTTKIPKPQHIIKIHSQDPIPKQGHSSQDVLNQDNASVQTEVTPVVIHDCEPSNTDEEEAFKSPQAGSLPYNLSEEIDSQDEACSMQTRNRRYNKSTADIHLYAEKLNDAVATAKTSKIKHTKEVNKMKAAANKAKEDYNILNDLQLKTQEEKEESDNTVKRQNTEIASLKSKRIADAMEIQQLKQLREDLNQQLENINAHNEELQQQLAFITQQKQQSDMELQHFKDDFDQQTHQMDVSRQEVDQLSLNYAALQEETERVNRSYLTEREVDKAKILELSVQLEETQQSKSLLERNILQKGVERANYERDYAAKMTKIQEELTQLKEQPQHVGADDLQREITELNRDQEVRQKLINNLEELQRNTKIKHEQLIDAFQKNEIYEAGKKKELQKEIEVLQIQLLNKDEHISDIQNQLDEFSTLYNMENDIEGYETQGAEERNTVPNTEQGNQQGTWLYQPPWANEISSGMNIHSTNSAVSSQFQQFTHTPPAVQQQYQPYERSTVPATQYAQHPYGNIPPAARQNALQNQGSQTLPPISEAQLSFENKATPATHFQTQGFENQPLAPMQNAQQQYIANQQGNEVPFVSQQNIAQQQGVTNFQQPILNSDLNNVLNPVATGVTQAFTDIAKQVAASLKSGGKDKDENINDYYKFYGTEVTISVQDWLKRIESQFEDDWSEVKKVQFATKRLDKNNNELVHRTRLDCPTFAQFKSHMILTYGSRHKPFDLSRWNDARRYVGTTFENWLQTPLGTLLLDKTTVIWDSGNLSSTLR